MNLFEIREQLLSDGKITANEVEIIKDHMAANGTLDIQDARLLIDLMKEANEVCADFDEMFFPCLKQIILQDGQVGLDEQFELLRLLYSDGVVRDCERRFLTDLYQSADHVTPEFKQLCETALNCDDENWSLGGE